MSYADEIDALKNHGHPMVVTMQAGAMRVAIKADAEIARLREALEQIARPPNIVGVYHSRAVDLSRAALAPVEVGK